MTEKEALKKDIIKKFKSLSYFCILTETPYKNTLAFFCSKDLQNLRLDYFCFVFISIKISPQAMARSPA